MDYDTYNKRVKIFDCNYWWADTKPVFINELDKSLIQYDINKFLIRYQQVDKSFIICEQENKDFILYEE